MLVCFFFGTFFFQIKKKVERSPFTKGKNSAPSADKAKVRPFHRSTFPKVHTQDPLADTEKNPRRFPLREFV
jgi:hypothetical protein